MAVATTKIDASQDKPAPLPHDCIFHVLGGGLASSYYSNWWSVSVIYADNYKGKRMSVLQLLPLATRDSS